MMHLRLVVAVEILVVELAVEDIALEPRLLNVQTCLGMWVEPGFESGSENLSKLRFFDVDIWDLA